jgi:hypothetical protein
MRALAREGVACHALWVAAICGHPMGHLPFGAGLALPDEVRLSGVASPAGHPTPALRPVHSPTTTG